MNEVIVENLSANLLTRAEVAKILGVKERTVLSWETDGIGPPHIRVGGSVRYGLRALNKWLRENTIR